MFLLNMLNNKLKMPPKENALPGRADALPTASHHFVNGTPIKEPFPQGMEVAMFGLGCFWGAERKFWELPGVYTTAAGYAAGHTPNPTYQEVCTGLTGHNEVVLVVYDPAKIGYGDLVKTFFESHDPTQGMRQGNDVGTQYRSGIYVFNEEQRRIAMEAKVAYRLALAQAGRNRASPRKSSTLRHSTMPKSITSNIWRRTPTAIAAWAARASPARWARASTRPDQRFCVN